MAFDIVKAMMIWPFKDARGIFRIDIWHITVNVEVSFLVQSVLMMMMWLQLWRFHVLIGFCTVNRQLLMLLQSWILLGCDFCTQFGCNRFCCRLCCAVHFWRWMLMGFRCRWFCAIRFMFTCLGIRYVLLFLPYIWFGNFLSYWYKI